MTAQFEAEQQKRIELSAQMDNIHLQIQNGVIIDSEAANITSQLATLKAELMEEIVKMAQNRDDGATGNTAAATSQGTTGVRGVTSAYDSSRRIVIRGLRPSNQRW